MGQDQIAAVFNEWAKRYADDPDQFGPILDTDGRPIEDYGARCAAYFMQVAVSIGFLGSIPSPPPASAM